MMSIFFKFKVIKKSLKKNKLIFLKFNNKNYNKLIKMIT